MRKSWFLSFYRQLVDAASEQVVQASCHTRSSLHQLAQFEREPECAAFALLRFQRTCAVKLLNDLLRDVKAHADALRVQRFARILDEAEQLEQFRLVRLRDADSIVDHLQAHCVWLAVGQLKTASDFDLAVVGSKLERVALEIEQHLLQPHLVGQHLAVDVAEILEGREKVDALGLGFVFLDFDDFLDGLAKTEPFDVLDEGALVNLGKTQQVADVKLEQLRRRLLSLCDCQNLLAVLLHLRCICVCQFSGENSSEKLHQLGGAILELEVGGQNGVDRIPHFVAHAGVDELQNLFSPLLRSNKIDEVWSWRLTTVKWFANISSRHTFTEKYRVSFGLSST